MAGRILVLDDEETYARILFDLLRMLKYDVEMSTRPTKALKELKEKEFDLVVADYVMPEMDGGEFLRKAREINPALPVIIISGRMSMPDFVRVANEGVTRVLEKPVTAEEFLRTVAEFVPPPSESREPLEKTSGAVRITEVHEHTVRSYPWDLNYLTDESEATAVFLQELWEALEHASELVVVGRPGAEIELIAKEVAAWRELPSESVNWADARSENLESPGDGITLYFFPVGKEVSELSDALSSLPRVELPPLSQRLADLAQFLKRELQAAANDAGIDAPALSEEAVGSLLAYDWPGEYAEVSEVARSLAAPAGAEALGIDDVRRVIEPVSGDSSEERAAGLKPFLVARQQSLLRARGAKPLVVADDSALLFPELLKA